MKKVIVAILVFLVSASLFSQTKKMEFEEYTLANGLQVILNKDNSSPVVVLNICYHVGAKNEVEGRRGFAHLFEHLMFDGSTNVKRGEFFKYVQDAGGNLNAFTSSDITNYYEILPPHELELALWLESDRMFQFSIGEISLTTQQGVVVEEKKQSYDSRPYGTAYQNLYDMAFKYHPYKITVIGLVEDIKAATLDDVKDFFETFYVPNNATLVVAGDIDVKETKKLIEKYFGSIPKGTKEIPRTFPTEPPRPAQEVKLVYDKIMLDALIMGYHIPEENHKDSYALSLLGNILSSGRSSRLYERMVYTDQVATQVSGRASSSEDPDLFMFMAFSSGKADAQELEKIIYEEIEKIQTQGVTEKELEKVKNQYEAAFVRRVRTSMQRALSLAMYKVFQNDANLVNTELAKYLAVTTADVQEVAKKYLNKENSVVLYYKPEPK